MVYKSLKKPYISGKVTLPKKKVHKRRRVGRLYYIVNLIIAYKSVDKEELRKNLNYPSCFDRVLKKMKHDGLINVIEIDDGCKIVKLNRSGYDYFLRFKKRKPESFEKLFGEQLRRLKININEKERDILFGMKGTRK